MFDVGIPLFMGSSPSRRRLVYSSVRFELVMGRDIAIILLQNSAGKLFAHKRSASKRTFPGYYGLGAGGHIEPGEAPLEGAKRELREELGISTPLEPLCTFPFDYPEGVVKHWRVHAFFGRYDGEPPVLSEEFQWAGWLEVAEVERLANDGKLCPDTAIAFSSWKEQALGKK